MTDPNTTNSPTPSPYSELTTAGPTEHAKPASTAAIEITPPIPSPENYIPHWLEVDIQRAVNTWIDDIATKGNVGRFAAAKSALEVLRTMPGATGVKK